MVGHAEGHPVIPGPAMTVPIAMLDVEPLCVLEIVSADPEIEPVNCATPESAQIPGSLSR